MCFSSISSAERVLIPNQNRSNSVNQIFTNDNREEPTNLDLRNATCIVVDAKRKRYYVSYFVRRGDGFVAEISAEDNQLVRKIKLPGSGVEPVAMAKHPKRDILYVVSINGNKGFVIDTKRGEVTDSFELVPVPNGFTRSITITPDGKKLYITNRSRNSVSVFNTQTNEIIKTIRFAGRGRLPTLIVSSPDGKKVYVANQGSDNLLVIDTKTDQIEPSLGLGNVEPRALVMDAMGRRLYVVGRASERGRLLEVGVDNELEVLRDVDIGFTPASMVITTDQKRLYIVGASFFGENAGFVDLKNFTYNALNHIRIGLLFETIALYPKSEYDVLQDDAKHRAELKNNKGL